MDTRLCDGVFRALRHRRSLFREIFAGNWIVRAFRDLRDGIVSSDLENDGSDGNGVDLSWERQSPDWPFQNRQSGDWRSQKNSKENILPENPQSPAHAIAASFLGWTLDAFDFFVVVFLFGTLSQVFHVSKAMLVFSTTMTLATRPIGALIFGVLADRYGRRIPLMANVIYFSAIELLCGFSPNFTFFLVMRTLFGIGMGGEWGVGASLAMESAPKKWRGILSGILQSGYSVGYLLAAIAARFVLPVWGWRPMFWLGGAPALLALYIRARVPESEAWKKHRASSVSAVLKTAANEWKLFAYLIFLMTFMMFLSHGTQDLYPDFLGTVHHISPQMFPTSRCSITSAR